MKKLFREFGLTLAAVIILYTIYQLTFIKVIPSTVVNADSMTLKEGQAQNLLYMPFLVRSGDLFINRIEITQAIQDMKNSVPLVKDRPTIVRIYTIVTGVAAIDGVELSLTATRNGQDLGTLISGPSLVTQVPLSGDYTTTFNLILPQGWLSGDLSLSAKVDSSDAITEIDETNNTLTTSVKFRNVPTLDVRLVPVNYTHQPNGTFFPAPITDTVSGWIMKVFPISAINVSMRAPISFEGDLRQSGEWPRLVQKIAAIKQADGSPFGQVYYGILSTTNTNGDRYPRAFSGYAFIGWMRAGAGIEKADELAAHEIGHNFGLNHAPCGNPAGPDPNYPYAGASIGKYGLDVFEERVWSPGAPDNAKDFMSYCGPAWISDYHYVKLYQDQISRGFMAQSELVDGLLIRASFDDQDIPIFHPVYEIQTTRTDLPEESDYILELTSINGQVMASYPVSIYEAGENEILSRSISVVVERPSQEVMGIRLWNNGQLIGQKALSPRTQPGQLTLQTGLQGNSLNWRRVGAPALIRYMNPDGISWTTLGIDVTSGTLTYDATSLSIDTPALEVIIGR